MKLFLDIVSTLALIVWPLFMMMSAMLFDAPGSEANKSNLGFLLFIIFYPVIIFAAYKLFGMTYFRISANKALVTSVVLTVLIALLFDYPWFIMNTMAGIPSSGYFVKEDKVYYYGKTIGGAQAASFKVIGKQYQQYATDEKHVYFNGKLIDVADPASFTGISHPKSQPEDEGNPLFWKDKTHVYIEGHTLSGARPAEFRHLGGRYGSDSQQVYYGWQALEGADPASFQLLNPNMAKDDKLVFVLDKACKLNAPASQFRLLTDQDLAVYATDGQHVYAVFFGAEDPLQLVVDADPASFSLLERAYVKDNKRVYYRDSSLRKMILLEAAHAASFVAGNYDNATGSDAHDHTHYYLGGALVTAKK
ncbi:DKNYY domain-containing protein [Undibacterium sp. TJN19]|uniref:DKNYY domain-containing protein n=1 Tax=Undibacterium sp. TJN19 TaxID=3413055 RepID=UPI003BF2E4C0